MRIRRGVVLFVAALTLVACGDDEPRGDDLDPVDTTDVAAEPGDDPGDLASLDGEWVVDSLTVDGQRVELDPAWPVTLTVDGDQISGTAACNGFTGVVDLTSEAGHGRFAVSELSWTEMGCAPPAMEIEQTFLAALQAVDSYEVADGVYVAASGLGTNFHLVRPGSVAPVEPDESATIAPAPSAGLAAGGGLDGPVMYAAHTDNTDSMDALIIGMLELDGDCLYTTFEGNRYPVLWPYGTTWDAESSSVVLPGGTTIAIGGEVHGGGGYLYPDTIDGFTDALDVLERAESCAEEPYFEIAVLQSP